MKKMKIFKIFFTIFIIKAMICLICLCMMMPKYVTWKSLYDSHSYINDDMSYIEASEDYIKPLGDFTCAYTIFNGIGAVIFGYLYRKNQVD